MRRSVDKEGTERWRQLTPARYIYQGQELTVASTFQESTAIVLGVYFGGMTFVETAQGSKKYRAEISSIPRSDVRALCVDWTDHVSNTEIYHHRFYLPRAEVSETEDARWSRTQENRWGMTFAVLAPVGGSTVLGVWLTDDPAVLATPPVLSDNDKVS